MGGTNCDGLCRRGARQLYVILPQGRPMSAKQRHTVCLGHEAHTVGVDSVRTMDYLIKRDI